MFCDSDFCDDYRFEKNSPRFCSLFHYAMNGERGFHSVNQHDGTVGYRLEFIVVHVIIVIDIQRLHV